MTNDSGAQQTFKIKVQNNKIKNNQVTALHLMVGLLLIVLGLVTWMVPDVMKTNKYIFLEKIGLLYSLFGLFLIIVSIFFNKKIIQTKKSQILRVVEIVALSIIIIYSFFRHWFLPASYSFAALIGIIFAYLWEKQALKDFNIQLSEKGILLPQIWKDTQLHWKDIKNVVVKHNVVTIDCRNNKLFQYKIYSLYNKNSLDVEAYSLQNIKDNAHLFQEDW